MTAEALPRVAVVTGASSGVGKATAKEFARLGWHVIGVGRNPERSAAAQAEIAVDLAEGGRIDFLRGDFERMADVARIADEIVALTDRVDVLVNNAGSMRDRKAITDEGNEITFASNHLAAFLLTKRLLPLLRKAAEGAPAGSVRVLAVSSTAHTMSPPIDWDDLQMTGDAHHFGSTYCFAKLANLLTTRELTLRLAGDGIVAQAMHPGVVGSNFLSHTSKETQAYMETLDMVPPEQPARTLLWMATAPEAGVDGGRYFHDMQAIEPSPAALDDAAAARLWDESEKILAKLGY